MLCFIYVLCYVSRPLIHLFLQMLNYVLPYKCNCIIISNTFNVFKLLGPEFFNFSTSCISNVNNTGTKYVRII